MKSLWFNSLLIFTLLASCSSGSEDAQAVQVQEEKSTEVSIETPSDDPDVSDMKRQVSEAEGNKEQVEKIHEHLSPEQAEIDSIKAAKQKRKK